MSEENQNEEAEVQEGTQEPQSLLSPDMQQEEEKDAFERETEDYLKDPTEKPEGLPDEFWGDDGLMQDDLIKAYNEQKARADGLRKKLSKGVPDAPKSADDYAIEVPDEFKAYVPEDDIAVKALKEVGAKHGIGNEAVNEIIGSVMLGLKDANMLQEPVSEEQLANMEAERVQQEIEALGPKGERTIEGVSMWLNGAEKQGRFTPDTANQLRAMASTADGVRAIQEVMFQMGEKSLPIDKQSKGGVSKAEWEERFTELDANGESRFMTDRKFREETMRMEAELTKAGYI